MLVALQGLLSWSVYGIPAFLFLITVVVFFHELGHFSMARLFKVKIDTFSIGFGRAIVSWKDRHDTQWKISWIPLGGFVKFAGDADGTSTPDREAVARMSEAERAHTLLAKPLYQRALIVAAGPIANFILAIVILTGVFMTHGHPSPVPADVVSVVPHSAAEAAGIKPGDRIVMVDGSAIGSFDDVVQIVSLSGGQSLPIVVERAGKRVALVATPREVVDRDRLGNKEHVGRLGIAGKAIGDIVRLGPVDAFVAAVDEIRDTIAATFRALTHGSNGTRQISGVITIAKVSGQVAAISFIALIHLAALLSVSIGLVNLFPIPLLDGGHLLYYACEGVLGRPLGERAQDVGFRVGLAVVAGIFLLATWNDLLNLF
jgi:regulator of sigma E protease